MDVAMLAAFWGVSMLFVVTPGADWAYAIAAGLSRRTVPAVVGMLSGHLLATVVVAAGVGALVTGLPIALTVLTVLGAAYLVWLGVTTLRHPAVVHAAATGAPGSWWRWAAKGFGVSGLNPKVFLLFLAVLPQFTTPADGWPLSVQIVVLGLVHVINCAVVYLAVGAGAAALLRSRPTAARVVSRISGIAMIAIGAFLLVERLLHA